MLKEYQITMMCTTGQYRPVSCIVKKDNAEIKTKGQEVFVKELKQQGIIKICQQRYWGGTDLKRYGYTRIKVREYDREKIAKENAERYERIKEEKYASGEWKRPKGKGENNES